MNKIVKVYLDTNILIDYITRQNNIVEAVNYLFQKRRKEVLFTSSLAIAQTLCNLQKKKKTRSAFTKEQAVQVVDFYLKKLTILDLTKADIEKAKTENGNDMEDCIQRAVSKKKKCDAILTRNTSDFSNFDDVKIISPKIAFLKQLIN